MYLFYLMVSQEAADGGPVTLFFQYGVAGLVIAALLMGLLWAKPGVDDLKERATRAETQRDELLKVYEEKIIPKLAASDEVMHSLKPVLADVVKTLEAVKASMRGS